MITYQSSFTISLDAKGIPSGTFSGVYGGFYNGLPVTGTDTGDLTMQFQNGLPQQVTLRLHRDVQAQINLVITQDR